MCVSKITCTARRADARSYCQPACPTVHTRKHSRSSSHKGGDAARSPLAAEISRRAAWLQAGRPAACSRHMRQSGCKQVRHFVQPGTGRCRTNGECAPLPSWRRYSYRSRTNGRTAWLTARRLLTDSSSWKRMLAASGTHVQKSMAREVRSRNEALARGNGGLNKHTLACAGEDIIGVRVLTCHMWAVGRIWRRGARVEEPEPVRIGTHRFEPYLRLHVAHVGRDDKALHGRHYISQPRSIEQRDARACPSGREAVATYPGLLSQLCNLFTMYPLVLL